MIAAAVIDVALALRVILYYPENHWGYDINGLYSLHVTLFVFSVYCAIRKIGRYIPILGIVLAVLSAMEIIIFDKFNMLLEYSQWIERGMPSFG